MLLIPLIPLYFLVRPDTYLPHNHVVLTVPFDINHPPDSMIPMGETIHHPKSESPHGHPGIDFGWSHGDGTVSSASDGKVLSITDGGSEKGLWDVTIASGAYELRYKELKSYDQKLHKGSVIKKGEPIGVPGTLAGGFHWELASPSVLQDRFCPLKYFDNSAKMMIESIWLKVPSDDKIKSQFPDICSGDYKNKTD